MKTVQIMVSAEFEARLRAIARAERRDIGLVLERMINFYANGTRKDELEKGAMIVLIENGRIKVFYEPPRHPGNGLCFPSPTLVLEGLWHRDGAGFFGCFLESHTDNNELFHTAMQRLYEAERTANDGGNDETLFKNGGENEPITGAD